MKSTAKRILSFGSRITIELSEWLRPTYVSSSVVVPSLIVRLLSIVSSGRTACGSFSATRPAATRAAPAMAKDVRDMDGSFREVSESHAEDHPAQRQRQAVVGARLGMHEEATMERRMIGGLVLALLAMTVTTRWGHALDIDRSAVDFKTPADITWVRNAAGTNEQAVLFGHPRQPGQYVARVKWFPGNMSRPHFHPNDRFFVVVSGTWWMGTGETFDPASM